jgi:dipeptidyl aminopeptidase/acylaminoacyl peptidase
MELIRRIFTNLLFMNKGKFIKVFFLAFLSVGVLFGQGNLDKPNINSDVYKKWPSVSSPVLSTDGRYALYKINQIEGDEIITILSTDGKWEKKLVGMKNVEVQFLNNNKFAIYAYKDSIHIIHLKTDKIEYIDDIYFYNIALTNGVEYLIYKKKSIPDKMFIVNLNNGDKKEIMNVQAIKSFQLNKKRGFLVLETRDNKQLNKGTELKLLYLKSGQLISIWRGYGLGKILCDENNGQLVFEVDNTDSSKSGKTLWHYKDGNKDAELLQITFSDVESNLILTSIEHFSNDGSRLFVIFKEVIKRKADPEVAKVNIWSYKDTQLQSEQLKNLSGIDHQAIINVLNGNIIRILGAGDFLSFSNYAKDVKNSDDWGLLEKSFLVPGCLLRMESSIISTKDNRIIRINKQGCRISPAGKFVIYYDPKEQNFFSYEIATKVTRNITKSINVNWLNSDIDDRITRAEIAGWIENDKAVLLYDQFDIWEIDTSGVTNPLCLTNEQGRKDSTLFFLAWENYGNKTISTNEAVLLTAFNRGNKKNGFYFKKIGQPGSPILLTMDNCVYDITRNPEVPNSAHFSPIKAEKAECYIVQRQTAKNSPNYYFTKDFKTLKRISNVEPEKNFNWYTTELCEWSIPNGPKSQGILYKPENFDSTKKYPIIFYFYQKLSDNLNVYVRPEVSNGKLNISWYVSNGYLVFTPDVHYKVEEAGDCILNSIVSAADYITKRSYVDSKRMGLQGISWGGYGANYILTHTNIFAAICSASGASDFISYSGDIGGSGESLQAFFESTQYYKTNTTLWGKPEVYIKNSPVFYIDKVTTPFLMMATSFDGAVPFHQALELFNGLRRMGKKVWMLEYNDCEHGVWGNSAYDFDLRMQQFFNYYLKEELPARWMTEGRPANLKGIESRLDIDISNAVP